MKISTIQNHFKNLGKPVGFRKQHLNESEKPTNNCQKSSCDATKAIFFMARIKKPNEFVSVSSDKRVNDVALRIIEADKKSTKPLIVRYKENFLDKLVERKRNNPDHKILISINGYTGSGKTTICEELSKELSDRGFSVGIFHADNYFKDISAKINQYGSFDELMASGYDLDSPDGFDLDLLKEDLESLSNNEEIKSPRYIIDGTGRSTPKAIPVKPTDIILVEGIAASYVNQDVFDFSVNVEIDEALRKTRFMQRATGRNQTPSEAEAHWNYTNESAKKYIKNCIENCDLVISGDSNQESVDNFADNIVGL